MLIESKGYQKLTNYIERKGDYVHQAEGW